MSQPDLTLEAINQQVVNCRRCPRLVEWRETVAKEKVKRFADFDYWGKPVPSFGSPDPQLLIVGLAPAAHGANRTGRMFTGDRSGEWLYRALHKAGFANQPQSIDRNDGLALSNCYITAACRCAPPANKPSREEFENCASYLQEEIGIATRMWVSRKVPGIILCLGQLAFRHTLSALGAHEFGPFRPRPKFSHGGEVLLENDIHLINSYHPSQQNTFTKRLTEEMFDAVFRRVREIVG